MRILGQRIREAREARGFGLDEMERRLHPVWARVAKGVLSRMERGLVAITAERLVQIAWALDVDPGDLVRGLKPSDIDKDS